MKPGARPTACYYASFLVVHRWYTAHTQHHSSAIRHTIIMHDDCCLSAARAGTEAYPVQHTLQGCTNASGILYILYFHLKAPIFPINLNSLHALLYQQ